MNVAKIEKEKRKIREKKLSSTAMNTETNSLTAEQIEEFFKATEDGSVERLEQLFNNVQHADPNMTRFTESLLMAAIRTGRTEVAEYLIDQLAVDVKYSSDLHEFRLHSKMPIRHRTYSCRDLAYEKGMIDVVDLIDITSNEVTPNIKRHIQKRLRARLDAIHQAYMERTQQPSELVPLAADEEIKPDERKLSSTNLHDENMKQSTTLPIIHRAYKSRIEEVLQNIDSNNKPIDSTGKKSFRFSNYTLRFRLSDESDTEKRTDEKSQFKSTIPSLPIIPLATTHSLQLPTNHNRYTISESSTRLSMRSGPTIYQPVRRTSINQAISIEHKQPIATTTIKRAVPKRMKQSYVKQNYFSPQHALYNQPTYFMPVTLKTTATGPLSDSRYFRD